MCEKFVYKHLEKIEYVKNLAYFLRNLCKLHGQITREFLALRMRNFQSIFLYEHKHVGGSLNLY